MDRVGRNYVNLIDKTGMHDDYAYYRTAKSSFYVDLKQISLESSIRKQILSELQDTLREHQDAVTKEWNNPSYDFLVESKLRCESTLKELNDRISLMDRTAYALSQLSNDCLFMIFRHLDLHEDRVMCGWVCGRWRSVTRTYMDRLFPLQTEEFMSIFREFDCHNMMFEMRHLFLSNSSQSIFYGLLKLYPTYSTLLRIFSLVEPQLGYSVVFKKTDNGEFISDTTFTVEHTWADHKKNFYIRLIIDNPAFAALETLTVQKPSVYSKPVTHVTIGWTKEKVDYKTQIQHV